MQGKIEELVNPQPSGIFQNFYKRNDGTISTSGLYGSPNEACANIIWDKLGVEYLFTAQMTSAIHKFEKP